MKISSILFIIAFVFCVMALFMPVHFMVEGTYGVNILLFGLRFFFVRPDFASPSLLYDFLIIFATIATIQTLSLVGLYAKKRFHFLLIATSILGLICSLYIFFSNAGSFQDRVVVYWLLGLTFSAIGHLISTQYSKAEPDDAS
ncbi:MAG: hypothetical protein PHQ90_05590 [Sulfuricurvum sp.]|nr:hypothetical protein [Sulfuricurvum sp.]MDD2950085.1 hypothetical protein [Sulfuricurvum sp.]